MNALLSGLDRIFLDSAPVIYFVERHPVYSPVLQPIFSSIEAGEVTAVASPITLAECLVVPMRQENREAVEAFMDILGGEQASVFIPIRQNTARRAADIRSRYKVTLTDAFQIAAAIEGNCDALLTNDKGLSKVTDIRILLVDELLP
jgi:predicted nucleic acid-binding protein